MEEWFARLEADFEAWVTRNAGTVRRAVVLGVYVAVWCAALWLARSAYDDGYHAWDNRGEKKRADGNGAHASIDFAGQWLMGRMLVVGRGRDLYHYDAQWDTARAAYPPENEDPDQRVSDVEDLVKESFIRVGETRGVPRDESHRETLVSFAAVVAGPDPFAAVGTTLAGGCLDEEDEPYWSDERLEKAGTPTLGGPLYPPVNAFLMAPLARGDHPQRAYRILQVLIVTQAFLAGLGVSVLTGGRIWWPAATALILVYPGFKGAIGLGQNPTLTLMVLVWGWALLARGHEWAGGAVWGLMVFKPTWGIAFVLVPLVLLRWRFCLAMAVVGGLLAAATLPFVGVQCWLDWLAVGREASRVYDTDSSWIPLSRDLLGIPRRYLLDFKLPVAERDDPRARLIGMAMLLLVAGLTALRGVAAWLPGVAGWLAGRVPFRAWWRDVPLTGTLPGFLMLGGFLSCFHFMYYDVMLSLVGVFLMLDPPSQLLRPGLVVLDGEGRPADPPRLGLWFFGASVARHHPALTPGPAVRGRAVWAVASFTVAAIIALIYIEHRLPNWHLGATVQATASVLPEVTARGGEPLTKPTPPEVTFSTDTRGTPWDTFVLLALWGWAGVKSLREPRPAA